MVKDCEVEYLLEFSVHKVLDIDGLKVINFADIERDDCAFLRNFIFFCLAFNSLFTDQRMIPEFIFVVLDHMRSMTLLSHISKGYGNLRFLRMEILKTCKW